MVLTTVLSMVRYVSSSEERDPVDRLHSYFTTNMLVGLAILVSFKQFGGNPIECLTPDSFTGAWEEYVENFCFSQDTYNVPMSEIVDDMSKPERDSRKITYYQWVPFFLLLSAACFRLPTLLWRSLSDYSGINIKEVVKMALDNNNVKPEVKRSNVRSISLHLQGALRFHRRLYKRNIDPHPWLSVFSPYSSAYVAIIYLTAKFCHLLNVCAQLWLMNTFLQTSRYPLYGWGAVVDLINGNNWERSGLFPRITLCDLQMRTMGNVQEFTIQCVLLINLLNEKVFIMLWFWYAFLLFVTLGSFCYWALVISCPFLSKKFISRHLEMSDVPYDADEAEDRKHLHSFVYKYLRTDGIFVIRTLILRSGVLFATELLAELYRSYFGIEEQLLRHSNSEGNLTMAQHDMFERENKKNAVRLRKNASKRGNRALLAKCKNSDFEDDDDEEDGGKHDGDKHSKVAPPLIAPMPVFTPELLASLQKAQQAQYANPQQQQNGYAGGYHAPPYQQQQMNDARRVGESPRTTTIPIFDEATSTASADSSEKRSSETKNAIRRKSPDSEKYETQSVL